MIRPEEVAHRNYMLWEQSIDAYLRAHDWTDALTCAVPLNVDYVNIKPILEKYEDAGWDVQAVAESDTERYYNFTLPPHLTLDVPA